MSRPFGVALLLGGYDDLKGAQLYFSDPSGTFVQYKAKAIGAGSEGAQVNLGESWSENLSREEAMKLAMTTLKAVMEEKITGENVEMAVISKEGYKLAKKEQIASILSSL